MGWIWNQKDLRVAQEGINKHTTKRSLVLCHHPIYTLESYSYFLLCLLISGICLFNSYSLVLLPGHPRSPTAGDRLLYPQGRISWKARTSASIASPATTPAGIESVQKEGPHRCGGLWNHLLVRPSLSIFLRKGTYDERRGRTVSVWVVTISTSRTCCAPFKYYNHPMKKEVLSLCHRYSTWGSETEGALSTLPLLVCVWREGKGGPFEEGEDLPLGL